MTLKELARDAEDVQNACNLSGVVGGAQRAAVDLRALGVTDTAALNSHPIMVLWAAKIADLSGLVYHWPNEAAAAVAKIAARPGVKI